MRTQEAYDAGYADQRNNRQAREVFTDGAEAAYYTQGYQDAAAGKARYVFPTSGYAARAYELPQLAGRTLTLPRGRHPDTGFPVQSVAGGGPLVVTAYPLPGFAGQPQIISPPWPTIQGQGGPDTGVNLAAPARSFVVQAPGDGGTTGAYPSQWYRDRAAEARARGDTATAETYERAAIYIAEQEKAQGDPNYEYPAGYGDPNGGAGQVPGWRGPPLDPNVGYELYGVVPIIGGEPFNIAQIADRFIPVRWELLGGAPGDARRGFGLSGPGGRALQLAQEEYPGQTPAQAGLPGWVAVVEWVPGEGRIVRLLEADEIRDYASAIRPRRGRRY